MYLCVSLSFLFFFHFTIKGFKVTTLTKNLSRTQQTNFFYLLVDHFLRQTCSLGHSRNFIVEDASNATLRFRSLQKLSHSFTFIFSRLNRFNLFRNTELSLMDYVNIVIYTSFFLEYFSFASRDNLCSVD